MRTIKFRVWDKFRKKMINRYIQWKNKPDISQKHKSTEKSDDRIDS